MAQSNPDCKHTITTHFPVHKNGTLVIPTSLQERMQQPIMEQNSTQGTWSLGKVTLPHPCMNYTTSGRHTQWKSGKHIKKMTIQKIDKDSPLRIADRVLIMNYNSHGLDPKILR